MYPKLTCILLSCHVSHVLNSQSLLSLSRVIHALSTPGAQVPFRDSKLTRLLQPSLCGNAKMSIICCVTAAEKYLEETRSTLQFASRAKLVKTNATVNEVIDESTKLKRLTKELNELKEKQKSSGVNRFLKNGVHIRFHFNFSLSVWVCLYVCWLLFGR